VPIYGVDCVISAYRDYEQNTFAESLQQYRYEVNSPIGPVGVKIFHDGLFRMPIKINNLVFLYDTEFIRY
jgi:hypothetical protein